jgi:hypothetical protein
MIGRSPSPRPRHGTNPGFRLVPLELLSDEEGSVAIGWVAPGVLYARLTGGVSADIGQAYAAQIQSFAESIGALALFVDFSSITYYDLLARSAFVRAVLHNRRKFTALTLLTFSHETTLAERTFVSAIGEPVDVLREPAEFEVRLLAAAPHARQLISVRGRAQANSR